MANMFERIKMRRELRDLEENMGKLSDTEQATSAAERNIEMFAAQDRHHDDDRALLEARQKSEDATAKHEEAEARIIELQKDLGMLAREEDSARDSLAERVARAKEMPNEESSEESAA